MSQSNNETKNPLSKYFRQPAIYIKLPSEGKFWPEDSIDLPVTGELPIYPMTTRDEITLRTPDALMNGAGVVEIIQNCVPNIKNAWVTPSIDVDAILIAIRIASYGENMDVEATCPHCNESSTYSLNLQNCLSSIKCPNYSSVFKHDDLSIKTRPSTFFGSNKTETIDFERQKMLQALERADIPNEVKAAEIQKSMQRLVDISIDILVNSTEYIEIADGTRVNDESFIREFYTKSPSTVIKTIQKHLEEVNTDASIKPQKINCTACAKPYEIPVVFNYSSFFGDGS